MDGANQRFMHGKERWLADHLVVYIYSVVRGAGGANPFNQGLGSVDTELPVHDFDLRKIGAIQTEAGTDAKEYALRVIDEVDNLSGGRVSTRDIGSRTQPIRAYFLPWGGSRTYCGKLGTNAEYFITPTLNGCTFAFRGYGPNPSVAHSNITNVATQQADQAAMDADLRTKFGGVMPSHTVIKAAYKRAPIGGEDYRSTVIGFREGNDWHFFYQNYKTELVHGKLENTAIGLCIPIT
jgi:hypothetical protein